MFYGVTHLDMPVRDLARARHFWHELLGFPERKSGDGFADVEAGTVVLRLMQSPKPERLVTVRLEVSDVAAAMKRLIEAGCRRLYEPMKTPALELVGSVTDPDGHTLTLWRDLTEDEYEEAVPLPTEMTWLPESEALMQALLKGVPALFRPLARRKVVRTAEWLAASTNLVTRDEVIRGFILANAKITRYRAREPLLDNGIDPAAYRVEFETD